MAKSLETLEYRNPGSPILPPHPFRGLVTGSSGSGKTHWVISHWILNKDTPFDRVIWCSTPSSLKQEKLVRLKKAMPDAINFVEGIKPDEIRELIKKGHGAKEQTLIVFDDLIGCCRHPYISELFTSGRHLNCSTIQILQQIFAAGTRTHRLNTDWYYIARFGDQRELSTLAHQLSVDKLGAEKIVEAYKQSLETGGKYPYMFIDGQSRHKPNLDELAFRGNSLSCCYPELKDV